MAKSQIPTSIQNKFKHPQFKVGDPVLMAWMGEQEYGYVEKITERSGTMVYTVQTNTYRYPCGIQIGEHRSGTSGYILVDETKRLGSDELRKRIETKRIPQQSRRATETITSKDTSGGGSVEKVVDDVPRKRRTTVKRTANDVQSSNPRNNEQPTKGRRKSYSKLDEAIDKQKDFLRKFT